MTRQRQILVTVTYNDLGCIIDTKAEPYEEPNLQPTCNNLATDTISRQDAIDAINHELRCGAIIDQCGLETAHDLIEGLPPIQPKAYTKADYIMALHREYGCTLTRAEEAHQKALEYLRNASMVKG